MYHHTVHSVFVSPWYVDFFRLRTLSFISSILRAFCLFTNKCVEFCQTVFLRLLQGSYGFSPFACTSVMNSFIDFLILNYSGIPEIIQTYLCYFFWVFTCLTSVALCECRKICVSLTYFFSPHRQFLSDVITDTMQELQNSGTFSSLLKALSEERENKMHFYDIIARSE